MKLTKLCSWLLAAIMLAGCASTTKNAPIGKPDEEAKKSSVAETAAEKKVRRSQEWRPEVYVVQKGDTLYSIAFNYGFGYRELAELNGIQNPSVISIGQTIRLFPGKPITPVATENKPAEPLPKDQPKLVKYPYSEAAMGLIDKVQQQITPAEMPVPAVALPSTKVAAKETVKLPTEEVDDEKEEPSIDWSMPTQGKLIAQFSESASRKGIDIAGKLGQPVLASAAGKVVYSGSGLRGYGKLIIIKHNATYLSAYAHNDKILVKEGQSVTRGQKIAAMGSTDSDKVKLHFEVRRLGKPVDPAKFLPLAKEAKQ
jgi:lipoprotein NlpD